MSSALSIAELKRSLKAGTIARAKDAGPVSAVLPFQVVSIDEAARTAVFVMSDPTQDWVGDRLRPEGAKLAFILRNPQFLWAHKQDIPGLGNWKRIWVEDRKLMGEAWFTPAEIDEPGDPAHSFSERCWSLVKAGVLRAVSVFFVINEDGAEFNGDGLDVTDWTPLECSLVTVGMNPNALIDGKSAQAVLDEALEFRVKSMGSRPNAGGKAMNESTSGDGGSAVKPDQKPTTDEQSTELAKCIGQMKQMQATQAQLITDHAKVLGDHGDLAALHKQALDRHEKALGAHAELMARHEKALADGDSQARQLARLYDDLSDTLRNLLGDNVQVIDDDAPEDETDAQKSARIAGYRASADELWAKALLVAKADPAKADALRAEAIELHAKAMHASGKSSRVLSEKNYGRLKAALDSVQAVIDDHHAAHGSPDNGDEGKSAKPPAPPANDFATWFASLTPEQVKAAAAQLADEELRRARGSLD